METEVLTRPGLGRESCAEAEASPIRLAMPTGRFAVVGDLQPTSRLELWRESNVPERERIVREIAGTDPDFVILLGDLVFCGSSAAQWGSFDRLCAPVVEAGLPMLPVLGNHEYWWSPARALDRYFSRFPHLERSHWYARQYGPLALVFLDSNIRRLSAAAWQEQLRWLRGRLADFDRDAGTRGVLVLLHHPPYTNSTVTSDERHVQQFFVPPFVACRKAFAMIAGHVHSYERFERDGKTFLVAGGGGGPRVRLSAGPRRRHADERFEGPPVRFFHYLSCRLAATGVEVEVRGLDKHGEAFVTRDRFLLRFPSFPSGEGR